MKIGLLALFIITAALVGCSVNIPQPPAAVLPADASPAADMVTPTNPDSGLVDRATPVAMDAAADTRTDVAYPDVVIPVDASPPVRLCTPSFPAPDWHARAYALPIVDYRCEVRADGKAVLSSHGGTYQIVMADYSPNTEPYGRYRLYQLELDAEFIQRVLGSPPYHGSRSAEGYEFGFDGIVGGLCCSPVDQGFAYGVYFSTYRSYLDTIDLSLPESAWVLGTDWAVAQGNHELVHRFVAGTTLSSFFNEGLAMFVQDYGSDHALQVECGLSGYRWHGIGPWTDYPPLISWCHAAIPEYYYPGRCFWSRLEAAHGHAAVQAVISRLFTRSPPNNTYLDITIPEEQLVYNDLMFAFIPVLGEGFWDEIGGFGMSRTMAVGATPHTCP
jgi:hypothetical protein